MTSSSSSQRVFWVAIFLISSTFKASALNILLITTVQSRSHYVFGNTLANLLLDRGHHIYEITTRHPEIPHPNRTSFVADVKPPKELEMDLTELSQRSIAKSLLFVAEWSTLSCKGILHSQASKNLLALARDVKKRPHIDVVVHDYVTQQCLGPFASEFDNAPLIAMTAYGNALEMDEIVGGPVFPAVIPHDIVIHPFDQPLGWLKRLENKWAYFISHVSRYYKQYPEMNAITKQFFGENSPTIEEVHKSVSLVLVNSHPAIQGARPQLPAVVQVGGVHVPPVQALPEGKMKEFLDSAKDGFILISFGSIVPVSDMEEGKRECLFRAFERLRPMRILLKWEKPWNEAEHGPLPDNVFISPWIPQSDVQAHPNIRLFVTHCGGLSTIEIIARSVPIVGVPFIVDQFINANKLAALKAGVILPYVELNEDTFFSAVRTVLDDPQYKTAVQRLSSLYHDQPETPQERAVFWIEFVARHKNSPHLRSPGELMSWVSRWMIDDLIIVTAVILIVVFAVKRFCANLSSKTKTKQTKSKLN